MGIDQITSAVAQMDEVTQQNAALVEEAAGAAGSLQEQAAALAEVVSIFKVGAETLARPVPLRPAGRGAAPARPRLRQPLLAAS